jgi:hypothetical protein
MLLMYMKCCFGVQENMENDVPSHSASKEHQHRSSCYRIWHCNLTKLKWYRCLLQPTSNRDMNSVSTSYKSCSCTPPPYLWFNDEAHLHLNGFMNKQNTRFWTLKIHRESWRCHFILQNTLCGVQSASKVLLD